MRISDWGSDVCSSDLLDVADPARGGELQIDCLLGFEVRVEAVEVKLPDIGTISDQARLIEFEHGGKARGERGRRDDFGKIVGPQAQGGIGRPGLMATASINDGGAAIGQERSEEHTAVLRSLMRPSYAAFCLKTNYNK